MRTAGKGGYYAPEQFSSEWDYVSNEIPVGAQVAGNYSWKTNLWHIGCIMWQLITQREMPVGPVPEHVHIHPQALQQRMTPSPPRQAPLPPLPRPLAREMKWTYGAYLLQPNTAPFHATDQDLRILIMRFMMDDPADRPEMDEIQRIINSKVRPQAPVWTGPNANGAIRGLPQTGALFIQPPVHRRRSPAELANVSSFFQFFFLLRVWLYVGWCAVEVGVGKLKRWCEKKEAMLTELLGVVLGSQSPYSSAPFCGLR